MTTNNIVSLATGQSMTAEQMQAEIARLMEANAKLKAGNARRLTLKVSEKGAVSLYGMGRFPVTLYGEQWQRLLAAKDEIVEFLKDNADRLSVKD